MKTVKAALLGVTLAMSLFAGLSMKADAYVYRGYGFHRGFGVYHAYPRVYTRPSVVVTQPGYYGVPHTYYRTYGWHHHRHHHHW